VSLYLKVKVKGGQNIKPSDLLKWFLKNLGLEKKSDLLINNGVTLNNLDKLSEQQLVELGLSRGAARIIRTRCDEKELTVKMTKQLQIEDSSQRSALLAHQLASLAEGYFITHMMKDISEGMEEYIHITFNNGQWQGMKIVGSARVPRGKLAFKTVGHVVDITKFCTAAMQKRYSSDIDKGEDGFFWDSDVISVKFDVDRDKWFMLVGTYLLTYSRVHKIEALNAAQNPDWED